MDSNTIKLFVYQYYRLESLGSVAFQRGIYIFSYLTGIGSSDTVLSIVYYNTTGPRLNFHSNKNPASILSFIINKSDNRENCIAKNNQVRDICPLKESNPYQSLSVNAVVNFCW